MITLASLAGSAFSQPVISAKSGLVNYTEGKALLGGKDVQLKFGEFPQIPQGSELRTEEGRAEVLLGPGVFLRVGENSALRMVSTRLADAKVDLESGSAVLECAGLSKDEQLAFTLNGANISIVKDGVYRLDSAPARLEVYDGEARVTEGGQSQVVKGGRMLTLEGVATPEKFDSKTGDALYRWAKRRSEYLAMANVSAAKYAHDHSLSYTSNSWIWNPWYGSYTFLPASGMLHSFWGYDYFSPVRYYSVFQAPQMQRPVQGGYSAGYSAAHQSVNDTSGRVAAWSPGGSGSTWSPAHSAGPSGSAAPHSAAAPVAGPSGGGSRTR